MKNIVLALLSIGVGFTVATFGLKSYSNSISGNSNNIVVTKKTDTPKEEVHTSSKEEKPVEVTKSPEEELTVEENTFPTTSVAVKDIQKSFDNWEAYTKENIDLMSTFIPLDEKSVKIEKGIFLTLLRTGAYIPVKSEKEGKVQYQLTNIEDSADPKIKKSITSKASIAHQYFRMEGKKLPEYSFIDLDGKTHNKADTKGKLLVLKCWFITCKVCVEEFPELNELVDKYKDDNIEFVSLAFDKKDELIEFLKTKEFKYPTIPEQKEYMAKKLKVKQYPTHLIVDSNGVIIKMVNNVKTLTSELERIMGK
ncbi:TlpA family protein disulfide reductase [Tenacibaculum caenipelagi]|uniref:Peroxiredoxin n=1 Tax=Tenacibaculum caenipelagi TaxID=1325435 RepID=A0A4R6TI26_9FLAO|nr:TlpA disulfide reductase family protein [Tenacibaculum caenipelagi]TDQ30273.1 peroxiredoxin [Tenacibaculum caenipelagi]